MNNLSPAQTFRSLGKFITALFLGLLVAQGASAATTTITFDDVASGTDLTSQYSPIGVTASGVQVWDATLISPWPANSGINVAFAPTGLMTFTLDPLITGNVTTVSAYISGDTSVGIFAYDTNGVLVGSASAPAGANNVLVSATSSGVPIKSIQIHDGGYSFTIDTLDLVVVEAPPNTPPVANAGADKSIRPGITVQLDGSGSSDDNTATAALQYSWSLASAPASSSASLVNATTANPSFTPDVAGTYEIQLVVTDGSGLPSDPDYVLLSNNNMSPTAVASVPSLVIVGTPAALNGTGSFDPENDPLTFAWLLSSAPAGNTAVVTAANIAIANIIPNVAGIYEVTLKVSDLLGPSDPASVTFTATSAQDFAVIKIKEAIDIIKALDKNQFTHKENQKKLLKILSRAVAKKQGDHHNYADDDGDDQYLRESGENDDHFNIRTASANLAKAIERVDGCALNGFPDGQGKGRDWITDCTIQSRVYGLLMDAKNALPLTP